MKQKTKRPGTTCPHPNCGHQFSEVTRTTARAGVVSRVRSCAKCKRPYVTRERVAGAESDTGVAALATGVEKLAELLQASPLAHLPRQQSK